LEQLECNISSPFLRSLHSHTSLFIIRSVSAHFVALQITSLCTTLQQEQVFFISTKHIVYSKYIPHCLSIFPTHVHLSGSGLSFNRIYHNLQTCSSHGLFLSLLSQSHRLHHE